MSETEAAWEARGWVGAREVIDALKTEVEARVGGDSVGGMNPLPGDLAEIVDTESGLVGFAIMVRPDFAIAVPAGAHGMLPHIAAALLSALTSGRAPGT